MRVLIDATIKSLDTSITHFESATTRRLDATEQDLVDLRQRISASEQTQRETATGVETMQRQLATAEAQLPAIDAVALANMDRAPDPAIYTMGCPEFVAPQAVYNAITGWIADAGLEHSVASLAGDAPSKRFTLQLFGGREVSTPRSSALPRHLKLRRGVWPPLGTPSVAGHQVPLYRVAFGPSRHRAWVVGLRRI